MIDLEQVAKRINALPGWTASAFSADVRVIEATYGTAAIVIWNDGGVGQRDWIDDLMPLLPVLEIVKEAQE